jgi:hypothetical protein
VLIHVLGPQLSDMLRPQPKTCWAPQTIAVNLGGVSLSLPADVRPTLWTAGRPTHEVRDTPTTLRPCIPPGSSAVSADTVWIGGPYEWASNGPFPGHPAFAAVDLKISTEDSLTIAPNAPRASAEAMVQTEVYDEFFDKGFWYYRIKSNPIFGALTFVSCLNKRLDQIAPRPPGYRGGWSQHVCYMSIPLTAHASVHVRIWGEAPNLLTADRWPDFAAELEGFLRSLLNDKDWSVFQADLANRAK